MALPPSIELLLRQSQRGVGQINSKTSAISGALAPFASRVAGQYATLQGQEGALGGALSGSLAGAGATVGADIGGALQGIQAPQQAVQQYGAGQATMGQQSGAAVGALSSADLERLHSQGTAEQIYASALPRLAMLAGDQERRQFLAEAQQQLSDLSLREADQARQQAIDDREWAYKVRQDRLEQKRYARSEHQKARATAYDRKQEVYDRKRQAKLDQLAQRAAAQEYGLSFVNTMSDNQRAAASAGETARHHRETEAAARAREQRQAAKDAKGGATGSTAHEKVFYDSREDAFKRAREYANPKSKLADPMPRAKARVRLWAEFGAMLTGRGFDRKNVKGMIEKALDAAGY